jgi:hypothetical protein
MTRVRNEEIPTPECDKALDAKNKGWTGIGGVLTDFYDWLHAQGIRLAYYPPDPTMTPRQKQIARALGRTLPEDLDPELVPHPFDGNPNGGREARAARRSAGRTLTA